MNSAIEYRFFSLNTVLYDIACKIVGWDHIFRYNLALLKIMDAWL